MFRQPPFSMAGSRRITTPIVHTAQGAPQAATVARLEQALSTAKAHYLIDRHQGRIDPKKIQRNFNPLRKAFDPAAYLHTALAARRAVGRPAQSGAIVARAGGVGFYPRERLSISIRAGCATGEAGQCAQATPLMKVG